MFRCSLSSFLNPVCAEEYLLVSLSVSVRELLSIPVGMNRDRGDRSTWRGIGKERGGSGNGGASDGSYFYHKIENLKTGLIIGEIKINYKIKAIKGLNNIHSSSSRTFGNNSIAFSDYISHNLSNSARSNWCSSNNSFNMVNSSGDMIRNTKSNNIMNSSYSGANLENSISDSNSSMNLSKEVHYLGSGISNNENSSWISTLNVIEEEKDKEEKEVGN